MKRLKKQLYLVWLIIFILGQPASLVNAQGPTNFANCRLGAGGVTGDVVGYNMGQLNLGLYLDWTSRSAPPTGLPSDIEYLQIIRVHQTKADYGSGRYGPPRVYVDPPSYQVWPNLTTLASRAAAQPGSIWLIGNEPERVDWAEGNGWGGQDEITPEVYATAYHDIYTALKAADSTARVGVGGIIQPTTLRLAYLDRMWTSYYNQFGYSMGQDIDLWNIHLFIIREVLNEWGAEIPAGFNNNDSDPNNNYDPADAFLSNSSYQTALNAHHNMTYYRQFLEDFRAWMAAHGERNKPLINTEYGILMDLDNTSVINFMRNTFDYMFAATNSTTGFPHDENRLLQGWLWYSLNDNTTYFQEGTLFDANRNLTSVGTAWRNYVTDAVNPLASQPQQNVLVTNLRTEPNPASVPVGQTATVNLIVDVANSGNIGTSTHNALVVNFWNNPPHVSGSTIIATRTIADLPGCGGFRTVSASWANRPVGNYTWYVEVVPISGETNTTDNIAPSSFSVVQGLLQANLALNKTVDNAAAPAGSRINYVLTAINYGPHMAPQVEVNDLLPDGLTYVSSQASQGQYYNLNGVWEVGELANQTQALLTITVRIDDDQANIQITNRATITNTTQFTDIDLTNNSAEQIIIPGPELSNLPIYLPIIQKNSTRK